MKKIWLIPIIIMQPLLWWFIYFFISKNIGDSVGLEVACVISAFLSVVGILLFFLYYNDQI